MTEVHSASSFEAIVIGAGVIGSGVAFELSRRGLRTLSIDKLGGAGHGSTSSSSAVVRFNYSTKAGVALAWEGMHYWRNWADYLGNGTNDAGTLGPLAEYFRAGILLLKSEGTNEDAFLPLYEELGVPCEDLDHDETIARWPWMDLSRFGPPTRLEDERFWADPTEQLAGSFYCPDGGYISDPMLAAQNLCDAAKRAGAQFWFNTEVTAINSSQNRVTGVTLSDGRVVSAPVVVNVAGPYSFHVNQMAGVVEGMGVVPKPMRREVHVAPAPSNVDYDKDGVLFADLDAGTYTRPERGNLVLIGGVEPECDPLEWVEFPDDASTQVTDAEFELMVLRAARRITGMGVPPQKSGVVGVYDASPDWTPIYDRSDLDGFYMAIGSSGNQFKNAASAGHCMAELITAVEAGHDHDSDPLVVFGRFTGNPINLGTFSRKRVISDSSPATVLG
ncbi:MAG: FAD-binding oxidoreductase [Acidimicrobiales bacterium]|nr:FAD-binding oxidoreductase [Acidimicrobiales bacterium]